MNFKLLCPLEVVHSVPNGKEFREPNIARKKIISRPAGNGTTIPVIPFHSLCTIFTDLFKAFIDYLSSKPAAFPLQKLTR